MRQNYFKNAALLTGSDVVLRLAGMGLRIWLANELGGEGMGLYQLVLAVYSLFVTLATAGVSVAATRLLTEELSRDKAAARGMLVRLVLAGLTLGGFAMLVQLATAGLAAKWWLGDVRAAAALRTSALGLPWMAVSAVLRGFFLARRRVEPNVLSQLAEQTVRIAAVVWALSRTQGWPDGSRCALVSRALLDEVRAAARGKDSVTELLRLAHAMAQHSCRIPQALLHFRRELCADDVFSAKGRRALILSHELTMTGAPIVLVSAVPVLRSLGFEVVVLGPADEGSLPLFLDAGAAVVTRPDCVTSSALWGLATSADLVLANTVVEAPVVNTLNGSFVPVLWWLHDAFAGYPFISHSIPKALGKNIHVCAVGSHATAAMHSVRPDFEIEQLIYGLPDYAAEQFPRYDISFAGGRPLFVTVGSLEHRKGPDIFCNAIRLLPSAVREKAVFLFVGKAADKGMYSAVDSLVRDYPQTVFYRKRLERPEVKSLMEQCNCVVCASRDDPMPTFVTEGLIFGKPSIVSEHTGTAGLVTEGVDGFLYKDDDPQQLANKLAWAIEHPEALAAMHDSCRRLYEQQFSNESYVATLTRLVKELTDGEES